jgi:hypothetical protein
VLLLPTGARQGERGVVLEGKGPGGCAAGGGQAATRNKGEAKRVCVGSQLASICSTPLLSPPPFLPHAGTASSGGCGRSRSSDPYLLAVRPEAIWSLEFAVSGLDAGGGQGLDGGAGRGESEVIPAMG